MGKRGPKPRRLVNIKWSANFAYSVGLIATDGYLSKDGRHLIFVSKDREQIENFCYCLGLHVKIGIHKPGLGRTAFRVQFGDVEFYNFLLSIGLSNAKSRTIGPLKIPDKYFFDFLRGSFDGDGCFYSYWDPRWKSSFMFYTSFISASLKHVDWLQSEILKRLKISGHITKSKKINLYYQLKYAKSDSLKILKKIYPAKKQFVCLSRKRLKINEALGIIGEKF